jgi:hypothetical protein
MTLADDLIHRVHDATNEALLVAAHAIAEQYRRNAPIGDPELDPDPNVSLRDSVHIERHKSGIGYQVSVDTPYAARIEFDQRLKHPRGGGARPLHRAVQTVAPTVDRIVAGKVHGQMASGLDRARRR